MKQFLKQIPIVHAMGRGVKRFYQAMGEESRRRQMRRSFPGSKNFWEHRYATGGTSGPGSYNALADFKAEVINDFVATNGVGSVIEFGCGDGNQLSLAVYPQYLGFDVSRSAVSRCRERFAGDATKTFKHVDDYAGETALLTLSLDVIFHLVEHDVFTTYMQRLFNTSNKYVLIYSSNTEAEDHTVGGFYPHSRHRRFSDWVDRRMSGWKLKAHVPNRYPFKGHSLTGSFCDFYIYEKKRPD
jgi:SAM-dependent methyltransferase